MKTVYSTLCALALLALSSGTSYAWDVHGNVQCAGGGAIGGVTITVTGTSCEGSFNSSATTDASGNYFVALPDCAGCFTACLETSTLPSGDTLIGASCVSFCLPDSSGNIITNVNWTVNCQQSGCPPCVDPSLGLGAASSTTVLELGPSQVSITGPAGGIFGNIYIAPGGKANFSGGGEFLTGNVYLGAGATYQNSGLIIGGSIFKNQDLSAQIDAAYAAAANAAALPCTQSFTTLDGKSVNTIVGVSGINVICVQNINIQGKQIKLTGPSDAKFIFNITGQFVLNGGGAGPQIRVDTSAGLSPSDVLYNVIGKGQDIQFNGGGGGEDCCAAIVDGTLLAPDRKIALAPGLVNGEVISGEDISIVSGSSVRCPVCQ